MSDITSGVELMARQLRSRTREEWIAVMVADGMAPSDAVALHDEEYQRRVAAGELRALT